MTTQVAENDAKIAKELREKEIVAERKETISAIRSLAQFLETHKEIDIPIINLYNYQLHDVPKEDVLSLVKRLGRVEKIYLWNNFYISKRFSSNVEFKFCIPRECVCKRIVKRN
jgi:hypothetical protein